MSPCLRVSCCSNPTANCCSSSTNSQSFSRAVGPRLPRRPRSQSSRSMHRKTPSPCAERILLRPAFPLSLGRFERACVNNRCPRTILCIEASDQQWRRRIKDPSQRSNSWCAWACRLPSCAAALSLDPRVQTKPPHALAALFLRLSPRYRWWTPPPLPTHTHTHTPPSSIRPWHLSMRQLPFRATFHAERELGSAADRQQRTTTSSCARTSDSC